MRTSQNLRVVSGWCFAATIVVAILYLAWPLVTAKPWQGVGPPSVPGPASWYKEQYRLQENEMVRFIPPPFSPERRQQFLRGWANPGTVSARMNGQLTYYYGPTGLRPWSMSSAPGTLGSAVIECGIVTQAQVSIPSDLRLLPIDGDWIIRGNSTPDQRLAALAPILSTLLKRDIKIEKRSVAQAVIVASGRWARHPIPESSDQINLQLFLDTLDTFQGAGGGSGRLRDFLRRIEDITRTQIDNRIEDAPREISWRNHYSASRIGSDAQKLALFLDNLTRQTSITFTVQRQQTSTFEVSEGQRGAK